MTCAKKDQAFCLGERKGRGRVISIPTPGLPVEPRPSKRPQLERVYNVLKGKERIKVGGRRGKAESSPHMALTGGFYPPFPQPCEGGNSKKKFEKKGKNEVNQSLFPRRGKDEDRPWITRISRWKEESSARSSGGGGGGVATESAILTYSIGG